MTRLQSAILATSLVLGFGRVALADDDEAKAVIDKAVKALGTPIDAAKPVTWKAKGKLTLNDNENNFTTKETAQGTNHFRREFDAEIDGSPLKGVTVLDGDKAWRKIGDDSNKLEDDALGNEKRNVYLQIVGQSPSFLKGEGFKIESAEAEKVDGKPATALKITGPDAKEFQLFFDKESGLPVKLIATVADFQGDEYKQETSFSKYKEFDGVKRATKVETKRNGKKFFDMEITDFKVLDKADPKTFAEPKGE